MCDVIYEFNYSGCTGAGLALGSRLSHLGAQVQFFVSPNERLSTVL